MAFENINVDSLRSSIINCQQNLNHSILENMLNGELDAALNTQAKEHLKQALSTLLSVRYTDLNNLLNDYLNVCSKIEEYKAYQSENADLNYRYGQIVGLQFYNESYQEQSYNRKGKLITVTKYRTVENYSITNEMNSIKTKTADNNSKMDNLVSIVSGIVNK